MRRSRGEYAWEDAMQREKRGMLERPKILKGHTWHCSVPRIEDSAIECVPDDLKDYSAEAYLSLRHSGSIMRRGIGLRLGPWKRLRQAY